MARIPHLSRETADPSTISALLGETGCLVVDAAISGLELGRIAAEMRRLVADAPLGDNDFDGRYCRRVYDPFARTRMLDTAVTDPVLLAATQDVTGKCQFGMTIVSELLPGQQAQRPHRDVGVFPPLVRTEPVLVTAIWAIDAFTATNGATSVAPGSHVAPSEQTAFAPVEMEPGSMLLMDGRLRHGAGANTSTGPRLGVIVEYVAAWLRPADNHMLGMPPSTLATLPEELLELLGFNQPNPYFGFIGGRHPREWLAAQLTD